MSIRLLVLGKRGGILQWPEHVLDAAGEIEGLEFEFFALNHQNKLDRAKLSLVKLAGKSKQQAYIANKLQRKLAEFKPNALLIIDLSLPYPALTEVLNDYKISSQCKSYQWIGDKFPDSLKTANSYIDSFYFTDSGLVEDAKKLGLNKPEYLALAVNPKTLAPKPLAWEKRKDTMIFIGAYSENRAEEIRQIDYPLEVYGKGWESDQVPENQTWHNNNLPLSEVMQKYAEHKYVLNIINTDNIANGLNMRCFEVPASGATLISKHYKDFENIEYLAYNSPKEINKLINLAQDSSTYTDISSAKLNSYANRLRQILKKN